jgi:hypothetical protein
VFFENAVCLSCKRELGFVPEHLQLSALEPRADGSFETTWGPRRKCSNYSELSACNWMVTADGVDTLCAACRLNHTIPNLSVPENRELWAAVEKAKRRLVYSLMRLGLALRSKQQAPETGLAFDIKADEGNTQVLTGHNDGLITLNLAEADSAEREKIRSAMRERYRTLLGHFRHEIGHYFWDRLVKDGPRLSEFRRLFGDESQDYAAALRCHYSSGPHYNYADSFISAYASAHPWEDFAETFAHYLHLEDTLETAHEFGFTSHVPQRMSIVELSAFEPLMKDWNELVIALNELNRSMGLPDAYPFAISPLVRQKLQFVHALVAAARGRRA